MSSSPVYSFKLIAPVYRQALDIPHRQVESFNHGPRGDRDPSAQDHRRSRPLPRQSVKAYQARPLQLDHQDGTLSASFETRQKQHCIRESGFTELAM
ncbi:hypothetical protein CH63R_02842 [Colletotrichum higginsianum IMI 349063]|uniref:Uncharacterized protein n=1 Tax=Colletotrichum higginsianum (strain IMI 349063) TaxID=759273 RepID=A0A1B7YPZ3_COLHI|nr:hypothetical protein CH63R_02842 [Colletotrichum higginsianum IMI 349063]OBR14116.1 hypothetical protein CH63R_02842 [Colletotrichum higginsianum IMI 349063]